MLGDCVAESKWEKESQWMFPFFVVGNVPSVPRVFSRVFCPRVSTFTGTTAECGNKVWGLPRPDQKSFAVVSTQEDLVDALCKFFQRFALDRFALKT
jgi:hypothetical protein